MQPQSILKVTNVSEGQSEKHGFKFKTVSFSEEMILSNGVRIKSNNTGIRNLFPDREMEIDGVVTKFKGDALFNDIKQGDLVSGKIVRLNTSSYTIGERTVNSWKGVVFSEEDAVKYANSQLKANNAVVITADGTQVNTEAELAFAEPVL